jgi:hypothetical protein
MLVVVVLLGGGPRTGNNPARKIHCTGRDEKKEEESMSPFFSPLSLGPFQNRFDDTRDASLFRAGYCFDLSKTATTRTVCFVMVVVVCGIAGLLRALVGC